MLFGLIVCKRFCRRSLRYRQSRLLRHKHSGQPGVQAPVPALTTISCRAEQCVLPAGPNAGDGDARSRNRTAAPANRCSRTRAVLTAMGDTAHPCCRGSRDQGVLSAKQSLQRFGSSRADGGAGGKVMGLAESCHELQSTGYCIVWSRKDSETGRPMIPFDAHWTLQCLQPAAAAPSRADGDRS